MVDDDALGGSRLDNLPVGLYRSTPDGKFLEVNRTLVEMSGYPGREALLATNAGRIWLDPDERNAFLERLNREGIVRGYEMRTRRYDGSPMWVRNSVKVVRDPGGSVVYEGVVEDITERKRAEEALLRFEEQYRRMIEVSPEPIAIHRQGRFVYANPAALDLIGAGDLARVVGRPVLEFVHPDYHGMVGARVRRGYEERSVAEVAEEKLVRVDGRVIDVEAASIPALWEGVPATQVLLRDVTARREAAESIRASEARLAEAQHLARVGSWEWELGPNRFIASEELFRVVGLDPAAQGLDWSATMDLVHPDDREPVRNALESALSEGRSFVLDCRLRRADGDTCTLQVRGRAVPDAAGRTVRVLGTAQDVTDRKEIERELAEARDAALEASRLKSFFLANMSHEIRTPLNVILGYATLLAERAQETGDHGQDALFEGIDRAGRRLLETVHGILDLSKIETGSFSIDPVPVDVVDVLRREIADFELVARRKGLVLRLELPAEKCVVRFDEYCLSQALANLLSNAIKFTREGGVTVRLEGVPRDGAVIEVADTGVGIDRAYQARLFEAFSQEQSGYTREFEGSGLGLALTRRYVELNGGRVSVDSEKGRGARFRIQLPPAVAEPVPEPETARSRSPVTSSQGAGRPALLLVEDEEDTQEYMRAVLGKRYDVRVASTAREARELLERDGAGVGLVLMDLSLRGGEDGLSLTRSLRADSRFAALPVLVTTAHAFVEDRERSLEAGCDDYLSKPIDPALLLQTIERLLRR